MVIYAETSAATHNRANRGYHYPRSKLLTNALKDTITLKIIVGF